MDDLEERNLISKRQWRDFPGYFITVRANNHKMFDSDWVNQQAKSDISEFNFLDQIDELKETGKISKTKSREIIQ